MPGSALLPTRRNTPVQSSLRCGVVANDAEAGTDMSGLRARVAESFGSLARVFGNPGLRRLELAFLGSTMGHWTYVVGLSVYAYEQGGQPSGGVISVPRVVSRASPPPLLS